MDIPFAGNQGCPAEPPTSRLRYQATDRLLAFLDRL